MELNGEVLELIKTYPTDGTHKYEWPKSGSFAGVTKDLIYKGSVIAEAREDGCTFCCGLTFEIWFLIATKMNIDLISLKHLLRIKADWFVATGKRGGPADALVPRQLGIKIPSLRDAKPGDFVQLWRKKGEIYGSGHSVILLSHTGQSITYFSTQPATHGIGNHTELLDDLELHITRAIMPS